MSLLLVFAPLFMGRFLVPLSSSIALATGGVLFFSLSLGWGLSLTSFDWFLAGCSYLVYLIQGLLLTVILVWGVYGFVANSEYSRYLSTFMVLSLLSSNESGGVKLWADSTIGNWEGGWVEVLGPLMIQRFTQKLSYSAYTIGLLNYKSLLGLSVPVVISIFLNS